MSRLTSPLSCALVSLALAGAMQAAQAQGVDAAQPSTHEDAVQQLAPVQVLGAAVLSAPLSKPYAGTQVARGGRVGLLGNLDFMDTPFSQTSYTAELIANRQTRTVSEVLAGDPSIRDSGRTSGQASNPVFIRGLPMGITDVSFNGLRGIFPIYRQPVEMLERVEVLKGPSALLSGMGSSIAGDINLVPKRAADTPLARMNLGYMSDSTHTTHIDLGRRFDTDNAWGMRLNALYRGGDTPVDEQHGHLAMLAVALDYRGERLRLSLDALQQKTKLHNVSPYSFVFASSNIAQVPRANKAILLGGLADHNETTSSFRAEYDISDAASMYLAVGHLRQRSDTVNTESIDITSDGSYKGRLNTDAYGLDNANILLGTQLHIVTGAVQHKLALSADRYHQRGFMRASGRVSRGPWVNGNIHETTRGELPVLRTSGHWVSNSTLDRKSIAIADMLAFMEERLNVVMGVRKQYVEQESMAFRTHYRSDAFTPMLGIVIKPQPQLSIYASYVEGLLAGTVVNDAA